VEKLEDGSVAPIDQSYEPTVFTPSPANRVPPGAN